MAKRRTTTSSEVKARYNRKTYKTYTANFRNVEDKEIIEFMEDHKAKEGTTELIRQGIALLKAKRKKGE